MDNTAVQSANDDNIIRSLADYMAMIEKYPSSTYIFRGEHCFIEDKEKDPTPKPHKKRLSSAFRSSEAVENRDSIFIDFMRRIDEFYSLIGHRLSDVEKENFVAFSQHHWLQTNLLDITSSPLVALFMACDGGHDTGTVYIFDKDYIDVTDILSEFSKAGMIEQDLIRFITNGDEFIIGRMFRLIKKHVSDTFYGGKTTYHVGSTSYDTMEPTQATKERICKLYHCCSKLYEHRRTDDGIYMEALLDTNVHHRRKALPEVKIIEYSELLALSRHEQAEYVIELVNGITQEECMDNFPQIPHLQGWQIQWPSLYLILLVYFLKKGNLVFSSGRTNFCRNCEVHDCTGKPAFLPNLIYKPKITFERARGQHGFFIYQPYIKTSGTEEGDIALFQEAVFIKEVKIEGTKKILKQLDEAAINRGTIYGDYDNIAKYLKEKSPRS